MATLAYGLRELRKHGAVHAVDVGAPTPARWWRGSVNGWYVTLMPDGEEMGTVLVHQSYDPINPDASGGLSGVTFRGLSRAIAWCLNERA